MMTAEQIVASHKANVETLFGLTAKAFEGVEKLVELNMAAAKAALSESAENTQTALSVKDAQELLALQANLFQPLAEKAAVYSRQLYDIASGTGGDFTKAFEAQAALAQKQFASLIDTARQTDAVYLGILAAARAELSRGELVEIQVSPALDAGARLGMVTLAGRTELPVIRVFREFVRQVLGEGDACGREQSA